VGPISGPWHLHSPSGKVLGQITLAFLPAPSSLLLVGVFAAFVSDLGNRAPWQFTKWVVGLGEKQRRRVLVLKQSPLPHTRRLSVAHLSVTEKFAETDLIY